MHILHLFFVAAFVFCVGGFHVNSNIRSRYSKLYLYAAKFEGIHMKSNSANDITSSVALVSGTTVGAGILALPSFSESAGFIPSSELLCVGWLFMVTTGLLIAEVTTSLAKYQSVDDNNSLSIISLVEKTLGRRWSIFGGSVYVFIHYALLVAYIAQAGSIINNYAQFENTWAGPAFFSGILGGLLALGSKSTLDSLNNVFVVILLASFAVLIGIAFPEVDINNLSIQNYSEVVKIFPVVLVALLHHSVIPFVCSRLQYDRKAITLSLIGGSFIPTLMFCLWNYVILGIGLGDSSDGLSTLEANNSSLSTVIANLISVFSIAAIVTSFIGFFIGLKDVFKDMIKLENSKAKEYTLASLILIPSTIIATLSPTIFESAIDVAGTYGITILFCALPALMAYNLRR
jgi:tyrosine-specific transport protein